MFNTLRMLLLIFGSTLLLLNGVVSDEKNLDSGAEILYSMFKSETAQQLPEQPRMSSSVVTQISVESEVSEEYSESIESDTRQSSQIGYKDNTALESQLSQSGELQSYEVEASQELNATANNKMTAEEPMGRRLPPVRAPVFLTNPPVVESEEKSSVVDHSISSDELDASVDDQEQQALDVQERTTIVTSVEMESATGSVKDVMVVSSVQTSKSMEEGEISYEEYNSDESREENTSPSPVTEEVTTVIPEKSRIIELVVTSTSVIQEELIGNEMELQVNSNEENLTTTTNPTVMEHGIHVTQSEIPTSQLDYTSSPVTEQTVTVPSETVNNNSTIIYYDGNSVLPTVANNNTDDATMTSSSVETTSPNIQTQVVVVTSATSSVSQSNITISNASSSPQESEKPIGKSIKSSFDFKNVMTEDPGILAKLLPPTTIKSVPDIKNVMTEDPSVLAKMLPPTTLSPEKDKSVKFKTFTDKQGKTYTLKLLTEDPNVLAAMTPPPMKNQTNKVVKSFFDKTLGKNVTLKVLTEDPSILAAMTPPPRPNNMTQSVNNNNNTDNNGSTITDNETSATPKLVHFRGIPQQSGKLPILTRHNGTRKPFLRSRPATRNPRPTPKFRKLSDIVNRSRIISTKRPTYLMKAVHEGDYQQDPDKGTQPTVIVTTIRTTTTLSPIFRWGRYIAVSGNLKIVSGAHWDEDLRNPSSGKFKQLANDIEEKLDKIFRSSALSGSQYKGVEVDSFSKGSVLVDYTLYLKEDTRGPIQETARATYRDGLENGTFLGSYKVDPLYANFRVITPENILPPPSAEEATVFPHWAIPIVGSGIAAIVFLVILCVIRRCSARAARRKYGAPLTNDAVQENKKSAKTGYDNPVMDGFYDLDNVYNEKMQRRPMPYNNSSTSMYSNGSRSSNKDPKNNKTQNSRRNDEDNLKETRDIYARDPFGREPPRQFKPNSINDSGFDTWGEWEDLYDSRHERDKYRDKYYERDYDTTF